MLTEPLNSRRATYDDLSEQLRSSQENELLLTEQLADLEMALDDKGWRDLSGDIRDEFSARGRRMLATVCRRQAVSHPLIKRGLTVRIGYIWGRGVEVEGRAKADDSAADGEPAGQDVNAVVQDFWDDNTKSLTGSQAQEELERALGTDGGVFLAAFTSPLTGRVQVRSTPCDEITDIVTNPEDRDEPWYYIREYTERVFEPGYAPGNTRMRGQTVKVAHPALGYRPATRPQRINNMDVRWDAPILHIPVNRLDGWLFGVPDVYAAVSWARMYRDFLVDWAGLTHSLAKFAWKLTGDTKGKTARAANSVRASEAGHLARQGLPGPGSSGAGQAAAMGPGSNMEAIPKSGAHIDADSGKPLAAMIAAGLGLPVTMLLADPGVTGARATAETLDTPTLLEMGMRRLLWQAKLTELLDYVIDQAVLAPRGRLRGTLTRDDWGRLVVTLAGNTERTLDWTWPAIADLDPLQLVTAIVDADGTGKLPPLTTVRLLLAALGVKDADEVIKQVTDDDGNFIDPRGTAGDELVRRSRNGEDPAEVA